MRGRCPNCNSFGKVPVCIMCKRSRKTSKARTLSLDEQRQLEISRSRSQQTSHDVARMTKTFAKVHREVDGTLLEEMIDSL